MKSLQECQRLEAKCQEERGLGQEFAEEAQEWVKLTGKLSDRVSALKAETDQMSRLRKVGRAQGRWGKAHCVDRPMVTFLRKSRASMADETIRRPRGSISLH